MAQRPDVLTAQEAAALLHVEESTALSWARTGHIPAHKVGRSLLFLYDELLVWISQQPSTSPCLETRPPRKSQAPLTTRRKALESFLASEVSKLRVKT